MSRLMIDSAVNIFVIVIHRGLDIRVQLGHVMDGRRNYTRAIKRRVSPFQ
jgi:hypothetical protein